MDRLFPISVSIDEATLERLEWLAKERKSNRSAVIRELIDDAAKALVDSGVTYQTKEATK